MEATGITIGGAPVSVGDRVVYPNGGICKVKGVESKQIAGQTLKMLMLTREEDAATVMVPESKVGAIGLRKVATADAIKILFQFLSHSSTDPELDWKVRHRENYELMSAGGLLDTAQVLKGLHALAQIRPLPTKEREMYDSARHQLTGEIAAGLNLPPAVAENNIDYALTPPPGSGRTAPKDAPLDIKALRRSMGGKRSSLEGDLEEEEGEGDDIGLEAEGAEEKEEEQEEGAGAAEGGEDEDAAPKAKPAKAAEKVKAPKKPAAPKAPAAPKVAAAKAPPPAPEVSAPAPVVAAPVVAPPAPPVAKVAAPVVAPEPVAPPPAPKPAPEVVAEKPAPIKAAPVEAPKPPPVVAEKPKVAAAPKPAAKAAPAKAAPKAKPVAKSKPVKAAPAKKVAKAPAKAKPVAKKGARK